jgi:type II secretory pathway pseudopilin PulG
MRRDAAGFSMIELVVVVATVVLLAAAVAPQILSWIDEGKSARAASDAAAVAAGMNRFFQDTTRWPGQVEILRSNSTIRFLTVGDPESVDFPILVGSIGIQAATCTNGLSGVVANQTAFTSAEPSASNSLDVQEFLSKPPSAADYPNWHGPYLQRNVVADPWGSVFVVNVIPLFCGETIEASAPGGALGYGWILSGGPNRTVQTAFAASNLAEDADDIGISLSKRAVQAAAP